ncbi:MAG: hypothetical protein V7707_19920 [Motiliproteus sp.]
MSQQTELLKHDAELILSLYGNEQATRNRLSNIEKELRAEGEDIFKLRQQVAGMGLLQDPEQYRCSYHVYD